MSLLLAMVLVATNSVPVAAPAASSSLFATKEVAGDPWVAAMMTAGIPLGIAAAGYAYSFLVPPSPYTPLAFGAALAAPVTLGYGYTYAGDPKRGRLVTGGWPLVAGLTAYLASELIGRPRLPTVDPGNVAFPATFVSGVAGFAVGSGLYTIWAGWDAYQTAVRVGRQVTPVQEPSQ